MCVVVILLGYEVFAKIIPRTEESKMRWRLPSYRFRTTLWFGLGLAVGKIWQGYKHGKFEWSSFEIAGMFIFIGIISYLVWIYRHSDQVD